MKRLFALATLLYCGAAHADTPPSVWQRAASAQTGDDYDLHTAVQRRLHPNLEIEDDEGQPHFPFDAIEQRKLLLSASRKQAVRMLEQAGAGQSKSPLLRFDLGEAYILVQDYARARPVLEAALAEFPANAGADNGWDLLSTACGHLADNVCERTAYFEILRRANEDWARATPTLNLAETYMHLGDLKSAIENYREALRLGSRLERWDMPILATWGLAVALDRSGDRIEAEKQAAFATQLKKSVNRLGRVLTDKGRVYFVPEYEDRWYIGLEALAVAKAATTPREQLAAWQAAAAAFDYYVKQGAVAHDRWLPIAQMRAAQAHAEATKLAAAARAPEKTPGGPDVTL